MTELDTLLQTAAQRAQQQGLPYAGLLLPTEAAALLAMPEAHAVLVDVRSAAEWQFVGQVSQAVHIEYKSFPGMVLNPNFISSLKAQVPSEKKVLFLCRSGARSHDTACLAAAEGYTAFNILEGFEGDCDAQGHRGTVNGWKVCGLPWQQG